MQTEIRLKCRLGHGAYAAISGHNEKLLNQREELLGKTFLYMPKDAFLFTEPGREFCLKCNPEASIVKCDFEVIDIQVAEGDKKDDTEEID